MTIAAAPEVPPEIPPRLPARQSVRRGLVTALGVICVILAETPAVTALIGSAWQTTLDVLLVLVLLLANLTLRSATRRLAVAPDSSLDERQARVRDYAYRLTHRVLAVAFGLPLWLLFLRSSPSSVPGWLHDALGNGGLVVVYLELLFFLPTAVIAWTEPDLPEDEEVERPRLTLSRGLYLVSWGLLLAILALPFALSVSVPLSVRTVTARHIVSQPYQTTSLGTCRYVEATTTAGIGVEGSIRLAGEFCSNGTRIKRQWGLFHWDCIPWNSALTTVTVHCRTTFDRAGAMHLRYDGLVRSSIFPVLQRHITIVLDVRRDGHILRLS
ncbi:MAG TPA: hypothetical protein VFB58_10625 [Chloroflexota bacterium]|nr:hypothetical protein [Chloroflexota bacterium]